MFVASGFQNFSARLKAFGAGQGGNVAVLFGIAILPIMAAVGAAVDYTHANSVKAAMQAALDSTALMLSRDAATKNDGQLDVSAKDYFNALFTRAEGKVVTVNASYDAAGGSSLTVTATVVMDTAFMKIFGYPQVTLNSTAVVKWGMTKLRVALALDNTGSMAESNKIGALKTATKQLLTMLQNASSKPGDIQVSIIPFSKDVNVGASNWLTATWIDWTDWDASNGQWVGTKKKKVWVPDTHNTWNGCVTDRDQDYDVSSEAPIPSKKETLFPAEQYDGCTPVAVMPLGYNWSAMTNLVDQMQPNGNTNQTIGLAWAWHSLKQDAPLNAPPITDKDTQQVIILLTDGLNTQNRFTTDPKKIDERTAKICANIKGAGIQLYTVLVMAGNSSILQNCASKPDMYYALTTAGGMITAFNAIGTNLAKLRVAK